jgi:hypothetical protein
MESKGTTSLDISQVNHADVAEKQNFQVTLALRKKLYRYFHMSL